VRLAYADPPYPGKAHLYPEKTEVDHIELIGRLLEYDGWALSTDERSLRYVLGLCPENVRLLAWCRRNAVPFTPFPYASWEPVICSPARTTGISAVRNYLEANAPISKWQANPITGQKPAEFCEWVLRCLGAEPGDTLDDLFPGTGIMGRTFERYQNQLPLYTLPVNMARSMSRRMHIWRSTADPLPGFEKPDRIPERRRT
jgi:hypothetical protein